MDGIFWSPQVKKQLEEDRIFPAREELLNILSEYEKKEDFGKDHEIYEMPLSLMPHAQISDNSPFAHLFFYQKKIVPLRWTIIFTLPLFLLFFSVAGFSLSKQALIAKDQIIQEGIEASVDLEKGISFLASGNYLEAQRDFNIAYTKLTGTQEKFNSLGAGMVSLLAAIPISNPIRSGENILEAARHLARSGQLMAALYGDFSGLSVADIFVKDGNRSSALDFSAFAGNIFAIADEVNKADRALDKVSSSDVPESFRSKYMFLKNSMDKTSVHLNTLLENKKMLLTMLGSDGPRRYLILFQNSSEMRATGGFIGNVALLKMTDGRIDALKFSDVYDLDGQLTEHIIPPKPIQDISSAWSLHDANWFFDFPSSAAKINMFYEKDGGGTLDGVIALTSVAAEDLLKILGPVDLGDKYGYITSDNFVDTLNQLGENKHDNEELGQNSALEEIFNVLLTRLSQMNGQQAGDMGVLLKDAVLSKDIQIYLSNKEEQNIISSLNRSNAEYKQSIQAIAVVHSNINGFKTDKVMEEKIDLSVKVNQDGSAENVLTITRKHNGLNKKQEFYRKVNKDYIRIYAPLGSVLHEVTGLTRLEYKRPFDYDRMKFISDPDVENITSSLREDVSNKADVFEENGRSVFGGWAFVSPGEVLTLKFTYSTPPPFGKNVLNSWNMIIEKQAANEPEMNISIVLPDSWSATWKTPENSGREGSNLIYNGRLVKDILMTAAVDR